MRRSLFLWLALLSWQVAGQETRVVSDCTFTNLEREVRAGGVIQLSCPSTILFDHEIVVQTNVTIYGLATNVLSGGNSTRLFRVEANARLSLSNLSLLGGYVSALPSRAVSAKYEEWRGTNVGGGAILNLGGTLTLRHCTFGANAIRGGEGGTPNYLFPYVLAGSGGNAYGGAVSSTNGAVYIYSCLFRGNQALSGNGGGVTNYAIPAPPGNAFGGAISHVRGQLTIVNSVFECNEVLAGAFGEGRHDPFRVQDAFTAQGGAISSQDAQVSILECKFSTNSARNALASGGAVYVDSHENVSIRSSDFFGNSAIGLTDMWWVANTIPRGGALYLLNCTALVDSIYCAENLAKGGAVTLWYTTGKANAYGGALFCGATVTVRKSAFFRNQCLGVDGRSSYPRSVPGDAFGGAIFNQKDLVLENSTFVENSAIGGRLLRTDGTADPASVEGYLTSLGTGGGLAHIGANCSVVHCTFSMNSAQSLGTNVQFQASGGASISNDRAADGVTVTMLTLAKTILASPNGANYRGSAAFLDDGYNLSSDETPTFANATSLNLVDPGLGVFGYYRGRTPTVPLLPGSPAIDAALASRAFAMDQRAQPRPFGAGADIGAYEVSSAPINNALEITSAGGSAKISLFGVPGRADTIFWSSDMITWIPLQPMTVGPMGRAQIEIPSPERIQFYLAVPQ